MIEDDGINETRVEKSSKPLLTPEAQKKFLYGAAVLILMGASFVGGRLSALKTPASPDAFSQLPTPQPLGTPLPVPESAFTMLNFTGVSESKKAEVLAAFNTQACSCNCKMSVASCIIKDPNCPVWKDHVTQMQLALGNGKKPDLSKAGKAMAFPGGMQGMPAMPQGVQMRQLPPH